MANSKQFIALLADIKADIITAILEESNRINIDMISVPGNINITLTTETYGLSSEVKLANIDVEQKQIEVVHLNNEKSIVDFNELSTDALLEILAYLEAVNKEK